MTRLQPVRGDIAPPVPSRVSQEFWNGCANHLLRYQKCERCGNAVHTPALICGACWSEDLAWCDSSGAGSIYSYTIVWRPQTPSYGVPYAPIIVELAEGWRMLSSLVNADTSDLRIGRRVQVCFQQVSAMVTLPFFQLAD